MADFARRLASDFSAHRRPLGAIALLAFGFPRRPGAPAAKHANAPAAAETLLEVLTRARRHSGYWLLNAGFFVCGFHVAFIATLASFIGVRGLGLVLTGGRSMYSLPDDFRSVANSEISGIPLLALLLVATYIIFHFALKHTRNTFDKR